MIKKLICLFLATSLGACIQSKQFENQAEVPVSVTTMFNQLAEDTKGRTPDTMQIGEYSYFERTGRIATGIPQPIGYETWQVKDKQNTTTQVQFSDGTIKTVNAISFAIIDTTYKTTSATDPTPVLDVQKEDDCMYVPDYRVWTKGCNQPGDLPPYQNYLLYNGFGDSGQKIFFNMATYQRNESLPQKPIDDKRCYTFLNCQESLSYIEFDTNETDNNNQTQRVHVTNSFNADMPYLASNPKQCALTIITINNGNQNVQQPYEECLILIDFRYSTNN